MIIICVIAVKPQGIEVPKESIMKDMFRGNADGAGFAYAVDGKVYIEKGFLKYKDFDNAIAGMEKRLKREFGLEPQEVPVMYHFRIGTHGPNNQALTHPFPVAPQEKHLSATDLVTDLALCHNGIIHDVTVSDKTMSDTTAYIQNILVPLKAANRKFYKVPQFQMLMENTISGSRFSFLGKDGEFELIGDWKVSKEAPGCFFSNLNHERSYVWNDYHTYPVDGWGYSTGYLPYETKVGEEEMYLLEGEDLIITEWNNINFSKMQTMSVKDKTKIELPDDVYYRYFMSESGKIYVEDFPYGDFDTSVVLVSESTALFSYKGKSKEEVRVVLEPDAKLLGFKKEKVTIYDDYYVY